MYRTVALAVIALAAGVLSAERSLALGLGSGAGTVGAGMASVAPAASPVASMGGGATAGRALRRRQAGVRPRRARKSCRRKEGRRASAPACMECPALAGAISATIPATAAEHRAQQDRVATGSGTFM